MKNIVYSLVICLAAIQSFAQNNAGIGTTTPDANAVLDIQSNNKGVLVPRVTAIQMLAIQNPVAGLLVYNTDVNKFYYYTGTQWAGLKLNLPDEVADNVNGSLIEIRNSSTTTTQPAVSIVNNGGGGIIGYSTGSNIAIQGVNASNGKGVSGLNTDAGHGVHARGANGTAVMAEIAPNGTGIAARFKQLDPNGSALVADGNLQLIGGQLAPAAGRILTSDAAGNASFQTAPYTAPRHGCEIRGIAGNGANVQTRGNWFKFHFGFKNYDANGDYRLYNQVPSSTFVVPRAGTYEINTMISFPLKDYDDCRVRIVLERGGIKTILAAKETTYEPGEFMHMQQAINLSTTAKLNATDLIYVEVYQYSDAASITFSLSQSEVFHYFTMALVDDL